MVESLDQAVRHAQQFARENRRCLTDAEVIALSTDEAAELNLGNTLHIWKSTELKVRPNRSLQIIQNHVLDVLSKGVLASLPNILELIIRAQGPEKFSGRRARASGAITEAYDVSALPDIGAIYNEMKQQLRAMARPVRALAISDNPIEEVFGELNL